MKTKSISIVLFVVLCLSFYLSGCSSEKSQKVSSQTKLIIDRSTSKNPWTHLDLKNNPRSFQFAIVSDRTGGERPGVFEDAVRKLNLLQPEFVMSVGDLIEGYTEDRNKVIQEWDEFDGFVEKLDMPFFYLPGNHDITNEMMDQVWRERYNQPNYHFIYHDVLFLCLNSVDGKIHHIDKEQIQWVKKTLNENRQVRWTLVFLHTPLWDGSKEQAKNWEPIEKALEGREYTVFAGHYHRYRKTVRQDKNYFTLATTGGGSGLKGPVFGQFDHVVWVTMTDQGPILANLMLDGIWGENVRADSIKVALQKLLPSKVLAGTSILVASERGFRKETQMRLSNDFDVPLSFKAALRGVNGMAVESSSNLQITIPPNSVESIPVILSSKDGLKKDSVIGAEIDWKISLALEKEIVELKDRSQIQVAKVRPITRAKQEIRIDGDLSEWKSFKFREVSAPVISGKKKTWRGKEDCRYRFAFFRDKEYLHIAVEVYDDDVLSDPQKFPWTQDGVEIRIDARSYRPPVKQWDEGDKYMALLMNPDCRRGEHKVFLEDKLPQGIKYVSKVHSQGYNAEVSVPIRYLNEQAQGSCRTLRLNVQVNDTDQDQPGRAQLSWQPDWRSKDNVPESGVFILK